MKNWRIQQKNADFNLIAEKFGISKVLARLLVNRDVKSMDEIDMFLNGGKESLHDPFLMKGMKAAVCLINDCISSDQKIRVIGDYDADGVCASYILKTALLRLGGCVDVYLPDRVKDGYGMNVQMAERAKSDNISLIITCDNGIAANEAISRAKELGLKVIVTDHHTPPWDLPLADVIINPKQEGCMYPFKELCGAAICYKLAKALGASTEGLLEFAGLATVADIVDLKGENRVFARLGMQELRTTKNLGLKALYEVRSIKAKDIRSYHMSFIITPVVNAAGRLESANAALALFEAKGKDEAKRLAEHMSELNEERKSMTSKAFETAENMLQGAFASKNKINYLVVYLKDVHESVAGIVAGRIKEKYCRPAIVLTDSIEGLKGSGRSIFGFNMIEDLRAVPELFLKVGGHALAAGFTLKSGVTPSDLSDALNKLHDYNEEKFNEKCWIDMVLPFSFCVPKFIHEIETLEPFGKENPKALFASGKAAVINHRMVGKKQNGLSLTLEDDTGKIRAIKFGNPDEILELYNKIENMKKGAKHAEVKIIFELSLDEYMGKEEAKVMVREIIAS